MVDVSPSELRVTVDYTYTGNFGTSEVYLIAVAEESIGRGFPGGYLVEETLPVGLDDNTATLTIRKLPRAKDFTSVSIQVCMSRPGQAIVCKDVPHTKKWTTATAPPDTGASPEASSGTCSISGRLLGQLRWNTMDDRGNHYLAELRDMYREPYEAINRRKTKVQQGGTYEFTNVTAGKTYTISPGFFRSQPRNRTVSCQPNGTHTGIDFTITGPPPEG